MRSSSLATDLGLTLAFSVLELVLLLIIAALLARILGPAGYGKYGAFMRAAMLLVTLFTLGLGPGLTRYVAMHRDTPRRGATYFWISLLLITGGTGLTILLGSLGTLNLLISGSLVLQQGLFLAIFVAANGVAIAINGWLRGRGRILAYNVAGLGSCIVRIFVVWFLASRISVPQLAVAWILALLPAQTLALVRADRPGFLMDWVVLPHCVRELLAYSLPRIPSNFGLQLLQSISVLYLTRLGDLVAAGYLTAGLSAMFLGRAVFGRLGLILLPHFSYEIAKARENREEVSERTRRNLTVLTSFLLSMGVVGATLGPYTVRIVVQPWFGDSFLAAIPTVAILSSAMGLYVIYALLSGAINAKDIRPLNTINIWTAVAIVWGTLTVVEPRVEFVALAQTAGYLTLAVLTVYTTCRLYGLRAGEISLGPNLLMLLINGMIFAVSEVLFGSQRLTVVGTAGLVLIVDLLIANALGIVWLREAFQRFSARLWENEKQTTLSVENETTL